MNLEALAAADLKVNTGGGEDTLVVNGFVGADAEVELATGGGDDTVAIGAMTAASLSLSTGGGADIVQLGTTADDDTSTEVTAGLEIAGDISVKTGAGDDVLVVNTLTADAVRLATQQGDDTVSIDADLRSELGSDLKLNTGPGLDLVDGVLEETQGLLGRGRGNGLLNRLSRLDDLFADLGRRIDDLPIPLEDLFDLDDLRNVAGQIAKIAQTIQGAQDLRVEKVSGQQYLEIEIDRQAIARLGLNVADVNDVLETAVGGKEATEIFEGERRFSAVVRLPEKFRNNVEAISNILLESRTGAQARLRASTIFRRIAVSAGQTPVTRPKTSISNSPTSNVVVPIANAGK